LSILSFEINQDADRRLEALASQSGKSKSELAADIFRFGMAEMEDYYRAVETSDRVRRGEERVYTSDELRRELGLEN
jgi:RHH-type rel operon transcriptional repressor/antitoxin RelB